MPIGSVCYDCSSGQPWVIHRQPIIVDQEGNGAHNAACAARGTGAGRGQSLSSQQPESQRQPATRRAPRLLVGGVSVKPDVMHCTLINNLTQ
jgi:hypothetical protein